MTYIDLELAPHRSMTGLQARWVIGAVCAVLGLAGLRIAMLGAWPVLPFLALDVGLLVWAFRASNRSAQAREFVRLDDSSLTILKVGPTGQTRRISLEPFWTRASLERLAMRQNRLWLTARDRRVRVGWFLSPAEREEIYQVIQAGLERYRRRG
jgi:uncharacterized membrane protein